MPRDLYAALCLVLVIEGLVLVLAPRSWQRMMREASEFDPRKLRLVGAMAMIVGAIVLQWVY